MLEFKGPLASIGFQRSFGFDFALRPAAGWAANIKSAPLGWPPGGMEPPGAANERWNFSLFPDMNQRPCEMFYRTLVSADISLIGEIETWLQVR
jgi:hypothetical protein